MNRVGSDESTEFDGWLSRQLNLRLDAERGPRPRPAEARYAAARNAGGRNLIAFRSAVAALGAKAAVGGAVVALAAGAAGTAATGSANPAAWGQRVAEVVEQCKQAERAADTTGGDMDRRPNVGQCVSAVAQGHGEQVRAQHSESGEHASPSPSAKPGQREGQEASPSPKAPGASGTSHGQGQGQGHESASPSPAPTDHGHVHATPSQR